MKILAIDTSGNVASASLIDEQKVIGEININYKQNHSVTIVPIIDYLLNMVDVDLKNIDFLACTCGPGSFTGLRIGAATIKAIAHVFNKKIIPISTLEVLAYNVFMTDKFIVPIIDAKAERIFAGIYIWENNKLKNIYKDQATTIRDILDYIKKNTIDPIFIGDGSIIYKSIIKEYFNEENFVPIGFNMQKSSSLGNLAIDYAKENKFVDYNNFYIDYIRKPQAQREMEERANK